jgi:hypothetical protein
LEDTAIVNDSLDVLILLCVLVQLKSNAILAAGEAPVNADKLAALDILQKVIT